MAAAVKHDPGTGAVAYEEWGRVAPRQAYVFFPWSGEQLEHSGNLTIERNS